MTENGNSEIVVGIFRDRLKAEDAIEELQNAGFPDDDTGFLMRGTKAPGDDSSPIENDSELQQRSTTEGALGGGAIGGVLGAALTLAIPGVGPIIVAGALAGIAAGGVVGGVIGTLQGIGIPEEDAKYYEAEFNAGRSLVTVRANGRQEEAREILTRHGAYDARTSTPSE